MSPSDEDNDGFFNDLTIVLGFFAALFLIALVGSLVFAFVLEVLA
jgi:F0F1-type ATP synthase membrane subunit c/vacuolar-type H+-ATPase subunit K